MNKIDYISNNLLPAGSYACEIFDVVENEDTTTIYFDIYNGQNKQFIDDAHFQYGALGGFIKMNHDSLELHNLVMVAEQSNAGFKYDGENIGEIEFSEFGIVFENPVSIGNDGILDIDSESVCFTTLDSIGIKNTMKVEV